MQQLVIFCPANSLVVTGIYKENPRYLGIECPGAPSSSQMPPLVIYGPAAAAGYLADRYTWPRPGGVSWLMAIRAALHGSPPLTTSHAHFAAASRAAIPHAGSRLHTDDYCGATTAAGPRQGFCVHRAGGWQPLSCPVPEDTCFNASASNVLARGASMFGCGFLALFCSTIRRTSTRATTVGASCLSFTPWIPSLLCAAISSTGPGEWPRRRVQVHHQQQQGPRSPLP